MIKRLPRKFHELVENKTFTDKTFAYCLLVPPKDATPSNFTEKTFTNSQQNLEFAKVSSLKSFPLYSHFFDTCYLCVVTGFPTDGKSFFKNHL